MNFEVNKYCKYFNNTMLTTLAENIFIGSGFVKEILSISLRYGDSPLIIVDTNTLQLLPKLPDTRNVYIFPHDVFPCISLVNLISKISRDCNLIIGVGSGTINDICKYSAFKLGKPYIIFPSALSVNGYTSCLASMCDEKMTKKSYEAKLPEAIFIDLDVVVNAPIRMNISGLYDFLCRSPARTDMIISHFCCNSEFDDTPFIATKDIQSELIKSYKRIIKRDPEVIKILAIALVISGMGISYYKSSIPASQGEHILGHIFDVFSRSTLFHGESVMLGMSITTTYQERFLSVKPNICENISIANDALRFFSDHGIKNDFDYADKVITVEKAEKINQILLLKTSEISDLVNLDVISLRELALIAEFCKCPVFSGIGIGHDLLKKIIKYAFVTRKRFTILDILHVFGNFLI